jgi:hypothetical protein
VSQVDLAESTIGGNMMIQRILHGLGLSEKCYAVYVLTVDAIVNHRDRHRESEVPLTFLTIQPSNQPTDQTEP